MKNLKQISFKIQGDYIELIGLLKALNLAESGGHAKQIVDQGLVTVNGVTESRKRAKLKPGFRVVYLNNDIILE